MKMSIACREPGWTEYRLRFLRGAHSSRIERYTVRYAYRTERGRLLHGSISVAEKKV